MTTGLAICRNGHQNPEYQHFCGECGDSLTVVCPKGHRNPSCQPFCGECGAFLAGGHNPPHAAPAGDLEHVCVEKRLNFAPHPPPAESEAVPIMAEQALAQIHEKQLRASHTAPHQDHFEVPSRRTQFIEAPYLVPYPPRSPQPPPRRNSVKLVALVALTLFVVLGIAVAVVAAVVVHRQQSNALAAQARQTSSPPMMVTCPNPDVWHTAPPSRGGDPDCYFVYMMTQHARLPASHGVPSGLVADAHAVCGVADQGMATGQDSTLAELTLIRQRHPDLSVGDAAFMALISVAAYCPWDSHG